MTPRPLTKKPLFWIVVVLGVGMVACCGFGTLLLGLGAMTTDEAAPTATNSGTPSGYQFAGDVSRGTTLTQELEGARWMAQYGSMVEHVVSRVGSTAWGHTNTSGSLHEITFDDDGSYVWTWSSAITMYGIPSKGFCVEKGEWSLDGTRLTLTPESQRAQYSSNGLTQEKEDEDLRARTFEVVDLTMENMDTPPSRFLGVSMRGPRAAWDTGAYDQVSLSLQRLGD